jgi:hypothetical protein
MKKGGVRSPFFLFGSQRKIPLMLVKLVRLGFCVLVLGSPVLAQDLGQLTHRAEQFWEYRKQLNRVDALQFVEPETRKEYLQTTEYPIGSYKIAGLEFPDDFPKHVDVLVKVHGVVINMGEMDWIAREAWVWKDGQWFMQASAAKRSSLFGSDAQNTPAPETEFKVDQTLVDVGQHTQGDKVEGKIIFRAPRNEIRTIRPLQDISGLAIGSPFWTDATNAYLPFTWQMTLLSHNISQSVTLQAITTTDRRIPVSVEFRAKITGKIGFKQVPEIISDPHRNGELELQLQNLSTKPLKILSVMSYNPVYVVDEHVPESIDLNQVYRSAAASGRIDWICVFRGSRRNARYSCSSEYQSS